MKNLSLAISGLIIASLACNLSNTAGPTEAPSTSAPETSSTEAIPGNDVPATEPAFQSACTNPYMPAVVGATWKYSVQGPIPDTYTHTVLSVDNNGFIEQDVFDSGVTRQAEWKCENGNLIALNPPGGSSSTVNTEGVQADFQTTQLEGITLPAIINPGDTWSQSLTLEGTETINGEAFPATNQITYNCTAIGIESVTVTAGTFDAMRMDCNTKMNITLTMGGSDFRTPLDLSSSSWYALNVGLIKTVSSGSGLDSTVELLSYTLP